jgi:hypothetical protein
MFSWIPIHRETIHRVLDYQRDQNGLLTILREMEQQGLKVIRGFTDFLNPGDDFVDNETGFKRAVLKKFQQESGAEKLWPSASGSVASAEPSVGRPYCCKQA